MTEKMQREAAEKLHDHEEQVKKLLRDQVAEFAAFLEVLLSIIVLVALVMAIVPIIVQMPGLLTDDNNVEIYSFLERSLDIVIGIEFIKMLAKHSPGSVLEVLLYAIARHMIVGHGSAVENLISVGTIALIFIIRKYCFVASFGEMLPGGGGYAPDVFKLRFGTAAEEAADRPEAKDSTVQTPAGTEHRSDCRLSAKDSTVQ